MEPRKAGPNADAVTQLLMNWKSGSKEALDSLTPSMPHLRFSPPRLSMKRICGWWLKAAGLGEPLSSFRRGCTLMRQFLVDHSRRHKAPGSLVPFESPVTSVPGPKTAASYPNCDIQTSPTAA
jgi:hypothetical protein